MKNLILNLVLLSGLAAQTSTIIPYENTSFPGNAVTYFAQNPVQTLGTVIDSLPAQTISSVAFRPNFRYSLNSMVYGPQIVKIYMKMSSGPQDTWSMTTPDNIDLATMKEPLGSTGTYISFPQSKTAFPQIGLQAFLSESFSMQMLLTTPYAHPGGNLQFLISWPIKANSFPISAIDTQIVENYMGTGTGYYSEGNQSLVYNLNQPFFCFVAPAPKMIARGIQETPNYVYLSLEQLGTGFSIALITPNILGQNIGWIGPGNVFCSMNFDAAGAIPIPFSSTTQIPIAVNPVLDKAYMSSVVIVPANGTFSASNPEVITYPTIYPARNNAGRNPRVPTIRSMEEGSSSFEWMSVVTELK